MILNKFQYKVKRVYQEKNNHNIYMNIKLRKNNIKKN